MVRNALVWAALGVSLGALAMVVGRELVDAPWLGETPVDEGPGTSALGSRNEAARAESPFNVRHALFEEVSSLQSAAEYEEAIRNAQDSNLPASSYRLDLLLDGLWQRDPEHAIQVLQELSLSRQILAEVLRRWVRGDPSFAISLMGEVYDRRVEEALAIEIISAVGYGPDLVRQLVSAGRTLEAAGLTAAFSIRVAGDSPTVALAAAEDVASYDARGVVLERIARILGESAPELAVSQASRIVDPTKRTSFLNEVYKKWAISDVSGFLEHIESADPHNPFAAAELYSAVLIAGEADPHSVLAVAEGLSGSIREVVLGASLEALAEQSPAAALEYLSSTSLPWDSRRAITKSIAAGYARHDVAAAANWLISLTDAETRSAARFVVLQELSATDLPRAIELELAVPEVIGVARLVAPGWLHVPNLNDLSDPVEIANLLAEHEGNREQVLLGAVVRRWADEDLDSALQWVVSKPILAEQLVETVATSAGRQDVGRALSWVQTVPINLQLEWVQAAVQASAAIDPDLTLNAVQALQNEAYRNAGILETSRLVAARFGPEEAARLAGASPSMAVVATIAQRWARSEPADALRWATRLSDSAARAAAVRDIFSQWVETDAQEAAASAAGITDSTLRMQVQSLICLRAPAAPSCG